MPLETSFELSEKQVSNLNNCFRGQKAIDVLRYSLADQRFGPIALVSSFGAESVVLLHMASQIDKSIPVIFVDTRMLFPETLAYQKELAETLGLSDIRHVKPAREAVFFRDVDNLMYLADTDACCALRKTEPLEKALSGFDTWISGRKRFQGGSRVDIEYFEFDENERIKVNPLAYWTREDMAAYIDTHNLPRHPLVAKGFKSIGCAPCTTAVRAGEDERAGRWRGEDKTECGIHFGNDGAVSRNASVSQNVIVRDDGFGSEDWKHAFHAPADLASLSLDEEPAVAVDLPNNIDGNELVDKLHEIDLIRIDFPSFSDGRGFSLARQLRNLGFNGRLRAKGHVIADQYTMARRSGFDEVEIEQHLAQRQPEAQWLARGDWRQHDYQQQFYQAVG